MAAFRLAREVGEWDVDGMLDAMPSPLFAEWCEFRAREPMSQGFYIGTAILSKMVADACGAKHAKVEDFMPKFEGTKVKKTGQQMAAIFGAFANAHNASLRNG